MSLARKGSNSNAGSGGTPKPIPILNVARKDYNNSCGAPRPILNDVRKDRNNSGGGNGEVIESFALICWGRSIGYELTLGF